MILGMSARKAGELIEKIGGTAIANQAILKCIVAGVPLTVDNVIYFVSDVVDPDDERYAGMIANIETAIVEVIETLNVAAVAKDGTNRH
jgi:hypothetical protein